MWSFLNDILWILNESAIYLLGGFALAGVLHVWLHRTRGFTNLLSDRGGRSVVLASLLGAPLPLCSCSVLPAAMTLRKKGASKGATASFLVSVPETDIVSILITYGLLGPVMAVFRPLAAVLTAIFTGNVVNLIDRRTEPGADTSDEPAEHVHEEYDEAKGPVANALRYGFVTFFDDIIGSLLIGVVLGGIITALFPRLGLDQLASGSFVTMLAMLVVGIPMYVCATSSTPIAVGLIAAGVSPGGALVFLLAGPATNLGSLVVLLKYFGRRALIGYVLSIAVVSLLMGLWLDAMRASTSLRLPTVDVVPTDEAPSVTQIVGSVLLLVLALASLRRTRFVDHLAARLSKATGLSLGTRSVAVGGAGMLVAAYLASGFFTVGPGQHAVVTRFGAITAEHPAPGLYYHWPRPFGRADVIGINEIRTIELGFRRTKDGSPTPASEAHVPGASAVDQEADLLTGSEDILNVTWTVHYRVKRTDDGSGLRAFLYGVHDPESLARLAARSAIRQAVSGHDIDALLTTQRAAVDDAMAREILQPLLDRCEAGIEILDVSLLDVHAPRPVHSAFRDVASAAEDKMTAINEAEEYAERVVREARAAAAGRLAAARGSAAQIVETAAGRAVSFTRQLAACQKGPTITRKRLHLETLEAVLASLKKYVNLSAAQLDIWRSKGQSARTIPPLSPAGEDDH